MDVGNYVGDVTPKAKIQSDRPTAASRQIGEISPSRGFHFFRFFVTPNFSHLTRPILRTDFYAVSSVSFIGPQSQVIVFLEGLNYKVYKFTSIFTPQTPPKEA